MASDKKPGKIVSDNAEPGSVMFQRAPMNAGGGGGKPSRSTVNDGINKPMGDGLTKGQTQWTKTS